MKYIPLEEWLDSRPFVKEKYKDNERFRALIDQCYVCISFTAYTQDDVSYLGKQGPGKCTNSDAIPKVPCKLRKLKWEAQGVKIPEFEE